MSFRFFWSASALCDLATDGRFEMALQETCQLLMQLIILYRKVMSIVGLVGRCHDISREKKILQTQKVPNVSWDGKEGAASNHQPPSRLLANLSIARNA